MTNLCILLVTEHPESSLESVSRALSAEGYTLLLAPTAEDALRLAHQTPPVAIIVDETPDNRLFQAQWLRTDPATVAVSILMVAENSAQRAAALEAGVDEFLACPLDSVEVLTRLRTLQPRRAQQFTLADFLTTTPDLALGANPLDVFGSADLLSHDLKNPLGIMISNLELLREYIEEQLASATNRRMLERELDLCQNALDACRRMHFLLDDMIDLAKLEADALPLTPEPVDVLPIVQRVLEDHRRAITQKEVTVSVVAAEQLPAVLGEASLIRRICNMLLDNALKFMTTGGEARFSFRVKADSLCIILTDNGQPITADYQRRIFERAVQWEARQNQSRSSIAMGLPFGRAAARHMRGDLEIASLVENRATSFTLTLPLAVPGAARD